MNYAIGNKEVIDRLDLVYKQMVNLINENKALVAEAAKLRNENTLFKKVNNIQKNSIENLEEKEKMSNIAMIISQFDFSEKQALKKAIQEQIKEINQCLKLLKV